MKKIALLLSSYDFEEESQVTESIKAFIELSQKKASLELFSFNEMKPSLNHKGEENNAPQNLKRHCNSLFKKTVTDSKELNFKNFDGLALLGGKNILSHFCNWSETSYHCEVHPRIKKLIESFYSNSKPLLALYLAPILISCVLGRYGITLTTGDDKDLIKQIEKTGTKHIFCDANDFITDREHKVITSPFNNHNTSLHLFLEGVRKAIHEFLEMS